MDQDVWIILSEYGAKSNVYRSYLADVAILMITCFDSVSFNLAISIERVSILPYFLRLFLRAFLACFLLLRSLLFCSLVGVDRVPRWGVPGGI